MSSAMVCNLWSICNISSKWMKGPNVRANFITPLGKKKEANLSDLGISKFLSRPKAQATKEKRIDK